jgi:8-oxo-dGTP pyrophosphatase MutT (NUDIX family)
MYEVFINNRPLIIAKHLSDSAKNMVRYTRDFSWSKTIDLLLQKELDSCAIQADDLHLAWETFKDEFKVIEAAGGVVMKEEQMLFIFRNGKWDLPKGKLEEGESIEFCAVREVEEECGVTDLEIVSPLTKTYHTYQQGDQLILKITHWFLMNCTDESPLTPQTEEGIELVEWKNEQTVQLALGNTYPNIIRVVEKSRG